MLTKPFFWLPMAIFLFILWMLLTDEVNAASILTALILSVVISWMSLRLRPDLAFPKKVGTMLALLWLMFIDIFKSNLMMIKLLLSHRRKQPRSGYVNITLRIQDPHALALLACIISFTPGTLWCGLSANNRLLRLHLLNIDDQDEFLSHIRDHYEKRLLEIFE